MSAHVQGFGYVLGAIGPFVLGAVHSATGTWMAPLIVTLGTLSAVGVAGAMVASAGPYRPRREAESV